MTQEGSFDGLAELYDAQRPRYPAELFKPVRDRLSADRPWTVVDAGAGTGIALETLLPIVPAGTTVDACDISSDMVRVGRTKFPTVKWSIGAAEPFIEKCCDLDLVLAAQAYQWMDRPRFVRAAQAALRTGGLMAVMQNNRHHEGGGIAEAYEKILEEFSPGYNRAYRSFDIPSELAVAMREVAEHQIEWTQRMSTDDFVAMSLSSTQAQRAKSAHNDIFVNHVRNLAQKWSTDGMVGLRYISEIVLGVA